MSQINRNVISMQYFFLISFWLFFLLQLLIMGDRLSIFLTVYDQRGFEKFGKKEKKNADQYTHTHFHDNKIEW